MKIALCIPMKDGKLCWQTHDCLTRDRIELTIAGHECQEVKLPGCSLPHMARNELVHLALDGGADRIVFIDDDTAWDAGAIQRMIDHDVDFVAAAVPYKRPGPTQWNVLWHAQAAEDVEIGRTVVEVENGLMSAHSIGSAMVCIKREAFDKVRAMRGDEPLYWSPGHTDKPRYAYYECPLAWGEDMRFCDLLRSAGGKIWIDPEIGTEHIIAPGWSVKDRLSDWLAARTNDPSIPPAIEGSMVDLAAALLGGTEVDAMTLAALTGPHGRCDPPAPRLISLLVPTRGRPDLALRYIRSALDMATHPEAIEIILGVDDDDHATLAADFYIPGVHLAIGPRRTTLGALIDTLHDHAEGEIIGWGVDDLTFGTEGWDDIVRSQVMGYGVFYPECFGRKTFVYTPFMTRAFVDALQEAQGYVCPSWFPFWFNDTWFDELAELTGWKRPMSWAYEAPDGIGKTRSMRDITFWAEFFERTREMRVQTAYKLLIDSPKEQAKLVARAVACARRTAHLRTPEFAARWEANAEPDDANPRYAEAYAAAKAQLAELGVREAA